MALEHDLHEHSSINNMCTHFRYIVTVGSEVLDLLNIVLILHFFMHHLVQIFSMLTLQGGIIDHCETYGWI